MKDLQVGSPHILREWRELHETLRSAPQEYRRGIAVGQDRKSPGKILPKCVLQSPLPKSSPSPTLRPADFPPCLLFSPTRLASGTRIIRRPKIPCDRCYKMSQLKLVRCAIAVLLLVLSGCNSKPTDPAMGTTPDSNWWMFQTDLAHTGHLRETIPTPPLVQKWDRDLVPGTTSLTPASFGREAIFIGSGYGGSVIYALSKVDGSTL